MSIIDLKEVRSVTEFQRNVKSYVGRLETKKSPIVLTVNGRAKLVVQGARSYQRLLDRLDAAETVAAIRRGIGDADEGRLTPVGTVAAKLRAKHGL